MFGGSNSELPYFSRGVQMFILSIMVSPKVTYAAQHFIIKHCLSCHPTAIKNSHPTLPAEFATTRSCNLNNPRFKPKANKRCYGSVLANGSTPLGGRSLFVSLKLRGKKSHCFQDYLLYSTSSLRIFCRQADCERSRATCRRRASETSRASETKRSVGDKHSFGDKKIVGDKQNFGDNKIVGDKKSFGDKKIVGDKQKCRKQAEFRRQAERRRQARASKTSQSVGDKRGVGDKQSVGDKEGVGDTKSDAQGI